jgi:hypothetical protein
LDHHRWPGVWPEQRAKKTPAPEWLERAPKDGSRLVGRELDRPNRYAAAAIGNGRLAGRQEVSTQPASPKDAWTNQRPSARACRPGSFAACLSADRAPSGGRSGHRSDSGRDKPAGERVKHAEQSPDDPMPRVKVEAARKDRSSRDERRWSIGLPFVLSLSRVSGGWGHTLDTGQ